MSRSWALGVALLVLALPSCKRSSRGGNGERHAARGDGGVLHGEGQLRLPGPRRARVLALAPGQSELALVVWQDTEGLWASTATTSQRIGEPDPEAVAAWDGQRVHVLGTLARLALTRDGSVVVRGPGVPGRSHVAVASAAGLVVLRERCTGPAGDDCTRFADVSLDHGTSWLSEQPLKLASREELRELVGFVDDGVPTWVEIGKLDVVRKVDATGLVHTLGSPAGTFLAACSGAPARVVWQEDVTHAGTVAQMLASQVPDPHGDRRSGIRVLRCSGDELMLAQGPGPWIGHMQVVGMTLMASHDGGATWSRQATPDIGSPVIGFTGVLPHVQLFFGDITPEDLIHLDTDFDEAGNRYLQQGSIHRVAQSPDGFGGQPVRIGVPDNSFMDGGRLVVGFDMDAWRILDLPDGRPLLVWLDLVAPDVQQEPPRELRGVRWRVLEALPR